LRQFVYILVEEHHFIGAQQGDRRQRHDRRRGTVVVEVGTGEEKIL